MEGDDDMWNEKFVLGILFVIAILLGIFSQDIAYFLGKSLPFLPPVIMLAIITGVVIALFIYIFVKANALLNLIHTKSNRSLLFLFIIIFIGFVESFWLLFVLAMWSS